MHPALLNQSYSSLLTLHSCPRKLELDKCLPAGEREQNVTFSFGHAVGAGVQALFCGASPETAIWQASLAWKVDIYDAIDKSKKDFWHVILAIKQFIPIAEQYRQEWEVASFNGIPAVELGFRISFPDGFKYRGYVDVVLRNKTTGQLMVIELKTTGNRSIVDEMYRNSGQAIGYSIIVDSVAKGYGTPDISSSFYVMYLVYSSSNMEFTPMPFPKSRLQRAKWIAQLMLEIEQLKIYDRHSLFPMHGESCYDFYRPCKYFGICELSNESLGLVKPEDYVLPATEDEGSYTIELSLEQLISDQIGAVA